MDDVLKRIDRLESIDGLAEGLTLAGISTGVIEGGLADATGDRRCRDPPGLQPHERGALRPGHRGLGQDLGASRR